MKFKLLTIFLLLTIPAFSQSVNGKIPKSGSFSHIVTIRPDKFEKVSVEILVIKENGSSNNCIEFTQKIGSGLGDYGRTILLESEIPMFIKAIDTIISNLDTVTDRIERYQFDTTDNIRLESSTNGGGSWSVYLYFDSKLDIYKKLDKEKLLEFKSLLTNALDIFNNTKIE